MSLYDKKEMNCQKKPVRYHWVGSVCIKEAKTLANNRNVNNGLGLVETVGGARTALHLHPALAHVVIPSHQTLF